MAINDFDSEDLETWGEEELDEYDDKSEEDFGGYDDDGYFDGDDK